MFNTTIHRHGPDSMNVTVNEHRAPTDESVRLLREMEQAAQQKADQTIRLQDCPIDCVVQRHDDYRNDQVVYRMLAKVGGKRIEAKAVLNHGEHSSVDTLAPKLVQALAEQIAINLLAPAFRANGRHLLRG